MFFSQKFEIAKYIQKLYGTVKQLNELIYWLEAQNVDPFYDLDIDLNQPIQLLQYAVKVNDDFCQKITNQSLQQTYKISTMNFENLFHTYDYPYFIQYVEKLEKSFEFTISIIQIGQWEMEFDNGTEEEFVQKHLLSIGFVNPITRQCVGFTTNDEVEQPYLYVVKGEVLQFKYSHQEQELIHNNQKVKLNDIENVRLYVCSSMIHYQIQFY